MSAAEEHRERQELDGVRRGFVGTERERIRSAERGNDARRFAVGLDEPGAMDGPQCALAHEARVPGGVDVLEVRAPMT